MNALKRLFRITVRVDSEQCIRIEPRRHKPPLCDEPRLPNDWRPIPRTIYRGVIR